MNRNQTLSQLKQQVCALQECIDLVSNGYRIIVRFVHDEYWYFKLKHHRNGAMVEVRADEFGVIVRKDGKAIKEIKAGLKSLDGSFSTIE